MARHVETGISPEEFYALPDVDGRHELVRGYVVEEPPPGAQHGLLAARICGLLHQHLRRTGQTGVVLTCDTWFELTRIPSTVRGPDVAFVTLDRYCALADVRKAVPGAPDLAVEVRSPSQSTNAMQGKVEDYLAAGAAHVWVVDAEIGRVSVYCQNAEKKTLTGSAVLTAPDVLPGFGVTVAELLADPAV